MEKLQQSSRPLPVITKDTEEFWEAAKKGKLVIQKCQDCMNVQHYPRMFCTSCLSENMEWVETTGVGTIYTYTIAHRPANPYMKDKVPYVVALVELPEGARIMTNIINTPIESIRIGAKAKVIFEKIGEGIKLPLFEQLEEL
jgi:uncharacterized protein